MHDKPNILLVIMDATRARNCSLYGHVNETTPFLETFAETATTYEQARSPGINSITSHTSIFTGTHVSEHNVVEHDGRVKPEATIWDELRSDHGYTTGLFTPNLIVSTSSNLSAPFETVVAPDDSGMSLRTGKLFPDAFGPTDHSGSEGVSGNLHRALSDSHPLRSIANCGWRFIVDREQSLRASSDHKVHPAHQYADSFLDWLDGRDSHWAACLNFMDAHRPYKPEAEFDRWGGPELRGIHDNTNSFADFLADRPWWELRAVEALYDGGIRQADDAIREIISGLKGRGEFEDTLIVIAADHGQGFGEQSVVEPRARMMLHSWGIHEVLTHVPLVVKKPGQTQGDTVPDAATLTNFPKSVRSALEGSWETDPFVPDGLVMVSTQSLHPSRVDSLPESEMIPHLIGPWKAVYETANDQVTKYVARDDASATVWIDDAQTSYTVANDDGGVVSRTFDSVSDADIKGAQREGVSAGVEDRLEDLGYLRT